MNVKILEFIRKNYQKKIIFCLLVSTSFYLFFFLQFINQNNINYPVADWWKLLAILINGENSFFELMSRIFSGDNEHRLLPTKLLMFYDYKFFQLDFSLLKFSHYCIFIFFVLFFIVIFFKKINLINIKNKKVSFLICASLSVLFLFFIRQWEIHYGYINQSIVLCFLLIFVTLFFYLKFFSNKKSSRKIYLFNIFLLFILAIITSFSMGFGLMIFPLLFVISFFKKRPIYESIIFFLSTLLIFYIYFNISDNDGFFSNDFAHSYSHLNNIISIGFFLFRSLYFVSLSIGAFWINTSDLFFINKYLISFIGFVPLIFSLFFIYYFYVKKNKNVYLLLIHIALFVSLIYLLMIGFARNEFIDEQAMVSRYMFGSGIFWLCFFVTLYFYSILRFTNNKLLVDNIFLSSILLISIYLNFIQYTEYRNISGRMQSAKFAVEALQQDLNDAKYFKALEIIGIDGFYRLLKIYKQKNTSIYNNNNYFKYVGNNINEFDNFSRYNCNARFGSLRKIDVIDTLLDGRSEFNGYFFHGNIEINDNLNNVYVVLTNNHGVIKSSKKLILNKPNLFKRIFPQLTNNDDLRLKGAAFFDRLMGKNLEYTLKWHLYSKLEKSSDYNIFFVAEDDKKICQLGFNN